MINVIRKLIKPTTVTSDHKQLQQTIYDVIMNDELDITEKIHEVNELLIDYKRPLRRDRQDFIFNKIMNIFDTYITFEKECEPSNFNILDIGGGNGYILKRFGKQYDLLPENLICLENSNFETEFRYNFDTSGIEYCFDPIHIEESPIMFNIIICMVSLHHMKDEYIEKTIVPLIKRKLKTNGILIIKEHDAYSDDIVECVHWEHHLYSILDTNNKSDPDKYLNNYVGNYKSKEVISSMFTTNGFRVLKTFNNIFEPMPNDFSGNANKAPTKLYWQVFTKVE